MNLKKLFFIFVVTIYSVCAWSQFYSGMTGLIHVPSAEMNEAGDARIGVNYIPNEMLPAGLWQKYTSINPEPFNTFNYYINITPFRWIEAAYECTAVKCQTADNPDPGYNAKDRHVSLKVNPLYEGKYRPAIALGVQDFIGDLLDLSKAQQFFGNAYIAATKHFMVGGNELAGTLAYRYYFKEWNKKYEGVVCGVTYRPYFAPYTRYIVEYDGHGVNVGVDALLWKHCMIQVATCHFNCFQAGIAYQINLLGKNKKRKWKCEYKREDIHLRDSLPKRHWDMTDYVNIPLSR